MLGEELPFRYTPERVQYDLNGALYEGDWTVEVEGAMDDGALEFTHVDLGSLPEKFELDELNQTLVVSAGTGLSSIRSHLQQTKYVIPYCYDWSEDTASHSHLHFELGCGPIGEAIGSNWPHLLQSQHGSWRDWVIGATIMLADGSVVKSGSNVVKSVSGFDLHKLMIGSRFTLGLLLEVCLRVVPRNSVSRPDVEVNEAKTPESHIYTNFGRRLYCVTKPGVSPERFATDYGIRPWVHDVRSGTFWFESGPLADLPAGLQRDVRTNFWGDEPEIHSPQTQALMRRTKQLFDPTNKLNPGEFGFI